MRLVPSQNLLPETGVEVHAPAGLEPVVPPPPPKPTGPLPVVTLFKATRYLKRGIDTIVLKWECFEADDVQINGSIHGLKLKGEKEIPTDEEISTYTLEVTNQHGTRKVSAQVKMAPPVIRHFKSSDEVIQIGYPIILEWEIENATFYELDQGIGEITGLTYLELFPQKPGTVNLTAKNETGEVTLPLELKLPMPEIQSFYPSSDTIMVGTPITLYWTATNASEVKILPEVELDPEEHHVDVWPDRTTTYTIIVSNDSGEVQEEVTVKLPPPKINHFGGEALSYEGAPVRIEWEVENAHTITVDHEIGEVDAYDHIIYKPKDAYTIFTLRAEGYSGVVEETFQVTRFPIPLDHTLLPPISKLITEPMKVRDKHVPPGMADLDQLEKDLTHDARDQYRKLRIKRAQELKLTYDMLDLEKASVKDEFRRMWGKVKAKFSKK
ncbi:hypothetical protein [Pontibacter sp. G13]|uniref:hypothetical protein n=1 Tax=Pontibacter sp. G13 TaxID=3074898 RepID=UPI002889E256|nr:hypothetical protein [Pontibacter sp. G13]WNJ16737.1 hypothetical protein RJD25_17865 [Pontibacter sp. G13]